MFKKTLTSNRSIALHRNYQNSLETATVITLTEITTKISTSSTRKTRPSFSTENAFKTITKSFYTSNFHTSNLEFKKQLLLQKVVLTLF